MPVIYKNNINYGGVTYLAGSGITAGVIIAYGGSIAPTGWLICDGSAVSRDMYSKLFSVIGTTYGAGDGSTTFNLPDLRGRVPIGSGTGTADDATAHALGDTNGEETHTLDSTESYYPQRVYAAGSMEVNRASSVGSSGKHYIATSTQTFAKGSAHTATAHNNMQPYAVINYIISIGNQNPGPSSSWVGYGAKVDISEYTRANIYTVPSDGIVQIFCGWETGCYCIAGVFNPGSDPNTTSAAEIECAAGTTSNMSGNLQAVLPVFKNQLVFIQKTNHQLNRAWFIPYI